MKAFKILLLPTVMLFVLTGCCWTDHSKTIKEVAEPMAKELELFYKKHKRFPIIEERNKMLEKVGCKVKEDVCRYKRKTIIIESSTTN